MRKSKYENQFQLGQKFGKWEIISTDIILHEKTKESQIKCQCECGFKKPVYCLTLIKGQSTACFNCGHGNKGENNAKWKGYKEVPGSFINRITSRSKKANREVEITAKDIYNLWIKQNKKCALSGLIISFINTNPGTPDKPWSKYDLVCTASLDRIDSNKGYTLDNIQLVHKDVNMIKKEYDQDYFLNLCKLITEHNIYNYETIRVKTNY
jgi:hypothetical protein